MPANTLIAILSLLILSGCSTTRHLKQGENFAHSGTTSRMKPQGEFQLVGNMRVVLKNAETIKAIGVLRRGDSLLILSNSQGEISLPLMDVQKIAVRKRVKVKGAWQGAGLGFLAVWAAMPFIGAIGAAVDPCEFECGFGPRNSGEGFYWGIIFGPVFGVIWGVPGGAIIGAIKGAEVTYIFSDSTAASPPRSDSKHINHRESSR